MVGPAMAAVFALTICAGLTANAAPDGARSRYGATRDRILTISPHAVTHRVSRDYEVHDGLGVIYVRDGRRLLARLTSVGFAAKLYPDVGVSDGVITAGDCWRARNLAAQSERMLLSSAWRLLHEVVPPETYFGRDGLDSLSVESDERGEVVGRRSYSPFGGEVAFAGDTDRHGFTGQELDEAGGLHFRHRDLDVTAGRWMSPDPLFTTLDAKKLVRTGESATAYAYVGNNPTSYVDPTGRARLLGAAVLSRLSRHVWSRITQLVHGGTANEISQGVPSQMRRIGDIILLPNLDDVQSIIGWLVRDNSLREPNNPRTFKPARVRVGKEASYGVIEYGPGERVPQDAIIDTQLDDWIPDDHPNPHKGKPPGPPPPPPGRPVAVPT